MDRIVVTVLCRLWPPFPERECTGNVPFSGTGNPPISLESPTIYTESRA